ncbi:MAG: CocE/NonD family hydrolase [Bacteroidota bacterium]
MKLIDEFPHKVKIIENEWIKMPDGTRLAARLWIPEDAFEHPVPAIFEYLPYRLRDSKRIRDEKNHGYFSGHGYACIRVDIRGSGDSEGVLKDEYLEQELSDGEEIIKWIAERSWCDGNVGMIGISWGGFNGLQLAARRPDALKAIVTVCSTDDRYADDVHYMGGCLLGDNLSWASVMFGKNSLPPDPAIVGDKWRDMWFDRLEGSGLWLKNWLEHPRRNDYWKHGSICENYGDIQIPVMAVSGWADGYSNAVFRMLENLKVPRMGLVGPWSHRYPNDGVPGPAIGFLQECLRWWDQYLKNKETGIDREPMLKAWMQESMPPSTGYEKRPGYWIGLNEWPAEQVINHEYVLDNDQQITENAAGIDPKALSVNSPLNLGMFAGKWCSNSAPPDLPGDQREEDGGALVFSSEPLSENLEIIGDSIVELTLEADRPAAMIAVRLSDVAIDDKVTRVTYGLLNLTHYKSHEYPEALVPGKKYKMRIQLNEIAHIFPPGHRIRLSVSNSYFPLVWPSPEMVTLKIYGEKSRLHLPVKEAEGDSPVEFGPAEGAKPVSKTRMLKVSEESQKWNVIRDLITDKSCLDVVFDSGTIYIEDIDLELSHYSNEKYSVQHDDLSSVKGETNTIKELRRKDWHIKTDTRTILTSDREYFYINASLDAWEGEKRVFSRIWNEKIARDHV